MKKFLVLLTIGSVVNLAYAGDPPGGLLPMPSSFREALETGAVADVKVDYNYYYDSSWFMCLFTCERANTKRERLSNLPKLVGELPSMKYEHSKLALLASKPEFVKQCQNSEEGRVLLGYAQDAEKRTQGLKVAVNDTFMYGSFNEFERAINQFERKGQPVLGPQFFRSVLHLHTEIDVQQKLEYLVRGKRVSLDRFYHDVWDEIGGLHNLAHIFRIIGFDKIAPRNMSQFALNTRRLDILTELFKEPRDVFHILLINSEDNPWGNGFSSSWERKSGLPYGVERVGWLPYGYGSEYNHLGEEVEIDHMLARHYADFHKTARKVLEVQPEFAGRLYRFAVYMSDVALLKLLFEDEQRALALAREYPKAIYEATDTRIKTLLQPVYEKILRI